MDNSGRVEELEHESHDARLLDAVRAGEIEAYGELYRAHYVAAYRYAVACGARASDRDDLVSMSFTDVLQAIVNGGGPEDSFRPYLFVSLRRHAARLARQYWHLPISDAALDVAHESVESLVLRAEEHQCALGALMSLQPRWRQVIWGTAVEGRSYAEVGAELGISEGAARSLAQRARQALRSAPHFGAKGVAGGTCQPRRELRDYLAGSLPREKAVRTRRHLAECAVCRRGLELVRDGSRCGGESGP